MPDLLVAVLWGVLSSRGLTVGEPGTVVKLRELHAPNVEDGSLTCAGCDWDGFEGEPPAWPCRTADLLYAEAEIAEIVSTFESWSKWTRAAEYRKRMASGWSFNDDLWQSLTRQFTRPLTLNKIAADSSSVTKIGYVVPVSAQLLSGMGPSDD